MPDLWSPGVPGHLNSGVYYLAQMQRVHYLRARHY
jgi:hypothetical protein